MAMRPPPPRRGPHSTAPPLVDDLMREIFLRLPPDDPRSLVRAAAGCRSWRGILSDAAFARDYRDLHGPPPMLGFLYEGLYAPVIISWHETCWVSHIVSTATFRPPACQDRRYWHVLDSRHGLVLFYTPRRKAEFLVCDLVTGSQWEIHADPKCDDIMWWEWEEEDLKLERIRCNAVVLCAQDACDHLDCHGGRFRVALVGSVADGSVARATVYSSETRQWSRKMIKVQTTAYINEAGHSAVVGNKVYVPCAESANVVVEYNMDEQKLSVIQTNHPDTIYLMEVDDGMPLFASVKKPRIYLWSMDVAPSGAVGWARHRVIDLEPSLPSHVLSHSRRAVEAVGFAEGVSVIFLSTDHGLYAEARQEGAQETFRKGHALHELLHWSMGAIVELPVSFTSSCWCYNDIVKWRQDVDLVTFAAQEEFEANFGVLCCRLWWTDWLRWMPFVLVVRVQNSSWFV